MIDWNTKNKLHVHLYKLKSRNQNLFWKMNIVTWKQQRSKQALMINVYFITKPENETNKLKFYEENIRIFSIYFPKG